MSSSNIKSEMHLSANLSENVFYPHKSSSKSENMVKNFLAIILVYLLSYILFQIN